MKRRLWFILFTAALLSSGLVFAQECATAKDNYTIGFANLTEDIVFTQLLRESILRKAQELGNVDIVLADNKLDGATALSNTESFITQGVNGIIQFQTDEAFGNVIMARARSADIPVIAIDIPMPGAVFFGADNYNAGRLAGEGLGKWVNENWGGAADAMLVLELPQSGPIPAARMQGMIDAYQEIVQTPLSDDQMIRLDSKNTQEEAFRVVSDTLPTLPNATKIVAITINDGVALGAIAAAEAAGRGNQLAVVGQGADPSGQAELVKDDSRYIGATGYFPERYGDKLLPAMIDILECRAVPPSIYVDHVFITKGNLCDYYAEEQAAFCNKP